MKRIYMVIQDGNAKRRLVKAATKAAALRHVVTPEFKVVVPTQDELVAALASGVSIEQVNEPVSDAG